MFVRSVFALFFFFKENYGNDKVVGKSTSSGLKTRRETCCPENLCHCLPQAFTHMAHADAHIHTLTLRQCEDPESFSG